jgi:iron(III) transport system ATP-binding protein
MISVTANKLAKRFGETVALDALDLRIEPGEIFFLLGPSGCGKTTLLRSIAGFCVPDSGSIYFGDEEITAVPPHRRQTGMMFQSYALWPHLTVAKNVAFGLEERKIPKSEIRSRVAEALEMVKMGHCADRKIAQLSGGQQQRVALARALVIRPRCLLLDEPLSNLDAKLRIEMRTEIRRICKTFGLTAIYVTHDQKEALSVGDRIAVLDKGRIQQVGPPDEVYRRPISKLVADFIGETNFIEGHIVSATDGKARVRLGDRVFEGILTRPGWVPAAGEGVTVSIRPEAWRLGAVDGGPNRLEGTLGESVYLGELAQYRFLSGDRTLSICELNPRFIRTDPCEPLVASVAPEDVVVLKE